MYRTIDTAMWTDPKVRKLPALGKHLFTYLLTNPHTHVSGLYYLPQLVIAHESGLSEKEVERLLCVLAEQAMAYYDAELEVVWVVNMLRHQAQSWKIKRAVETHLSTLHRTPLIGTFLQHYQDLELHAAAGEPEAIPDRYPMDTLSIPHGYPTDTLTVPVPAPVPVVSSGEEKRGAGEKRGGGVAATNGQPRWPSPEAFVRWWNEVMAPLGVKPFDVDDLPDVRHAILAALKLKPEEPYWTTRVAKAITNSDFLRGQASPLPGKKPFRLDLPWLFKKSKRNEALKNYMVIAQGSFANSSNRRSREELIALVDEENGHDATGISGIRRDAGRHGGHDTPQSAAQ